MEDVQISQIHVLQSDYSQNRLKRSIIYNVGSTRQSKGPFLRTTGKRLFVAARIARFQLDDTQESLIQYAGMVHLAVVSCVVSTVYDEFYVFKCILLTSNALHCTSTCI